MQGPQSHSDPPFSLHQRSLIEFVNEITDAGLNLLAECNKEEFEFFNTITYFITSVICDIRLYTQERVPSMAVHLKSD